MKKTFLEFLNEQKPEEMVYVGTFKGSGWLYIDTAQNLIEKIDDIEKKIRKDAERTLKTAQTRLGNIPGEIVAVQEEVKKLTERGNKEALNKAKNSLLLLEHKFVSAFNTRELYSKALLTWTIFGKRIVKDTYKHETDVEGICILVDGFENGKLWFKDEEEKLK